VTALGVHKIQSKYLNTSRLIADGTGTAVWRWDQTEAFGDAPPNDNPSGLGVFENNLRYPGQYADKETRLLYNYFRDYDGSIGRYSQSDPVGLTAGINTYVYVTSNPLLWIDSLGLMNISEGISGATGETSIHANPGPDVVPPGARAEHLPPHVHMGHNEGPRISTETFEPLTEEDARKLSRKQKNFCKKLGDDIKKLIRTRQMNVFKYGRAMAILAATPTIALDSVTAACKQDPFFCAEMTPYVLDGLMEQTCKGGCPNE
jgi:RHS repeat-associated protein